MMDAVHECASVKLVARVHCSVEMEIHGCKGFAMSENGIRGVDLFKIASKSISGWIPSWKLGGPKPSRQPFCSLTPLICLFPDSPPILPDPLPSHLESLEPSLRAKGIASKAAADHSVIASESTYGLEIQLVDHILSARA